MSEVLLNMKFSITKKYSEPRQASQRVSFHQAMSPIGNSLIKKHPPQFGTGL